MLPFSYWTFGKKIQEKVDIFSKSAGFCPAVESSRPGKFVNFTQKSRLRLFSGVFWAKEEKSDFSGGSA